MLENTQDKVPSLVADLVLEYLVAADVHVANVLVDSVRGMRVLVIEGTCASKQLKGEDSDGPVVYFVVVRHFLEQFRRQIVGRAAESHAIFVDGVRRPAEVADLDVPLFAFND